MDDLTTLSNIVDAIGNGRNKWSVIGADISSISDKEEARLYAELSQHIVKASGWEQRYKDSNFFFQFKSFLQFFLLFFFYFLNN